jgi:uncharacterized membrane protein YhaH (DUF805 family)
MPQRGLWRGIFSLQIQAFGCILAATASRILGVFSMHHLAFLLQNPPDTEMIRRIFMTIVPIMLVLYLVAVAVLMIPCWMILKKAGFSPWLALLCIIPSLGTLVLLYVLAFAQWKVVPAPQAAGWPPPVPPPPPVPTRP